MPTPVLWGNQVILDNDPANVLTGIQMMALPDGGFVGAWWEMDGGVRVQTFNGDGTERNAEIRVPGEIHSSYHQDISINLLSDGGYVVGWYAYNAQMGTVMQAAIFNADGSLRRSAYTISKEPSEYQVEHDIVPLANGGFMALYIHSIGDGKNGDILGRIYNASGELIKDSFIATGQVLGGQVSPSAARLHNGNIALTYVDASEPSQVVVRLRILKPDGTSAYSGPDVSIPGRIGHQLQPSVTALKDGRILVTWFDSGGDDIFARIFEQDGTPVGSANIAVNTTATGDQFEPVVTALTDGGFAIAFEDWGQSTSTQRTSDVRMVTFDAAGTRQSDDILAHAPSTGTQFRPHITTLADGRFVVAWTDHATLPNHSFGNIVGQIFDARVAPMTINGTAGNDYYVGTKESGDVLRGEGGNDTLLGGEGNDTLVGGNSDDFLIGEAGSDRLYAGKGDDRIWGGKQNRTDTEGYDIVTYEDVDDPNGIVLNFTTKIHGGAAKNDQIFDIDGYVGSGFNDIMTGSAADFDIFYGDKGNDILNGEGGTDILLGEAGNDTLNGGAGNDTLDGGAGSNTAVFSGKRGDYAIGAKAADGTFTVTGTDGIDVLKNVRVLQFGSGEVIALSNSAPTGLSLSNAGTVENAPVGAVVGDLAASDADGDQLTYSLAAGSSSAFAIQGNSLVVASALDFETQPSHQVTILASDGFGGSTSLTVTLTVGNAMDTTPFTIRGTARSDGLSGENGNDTIYGSGGNDQLTGHGGKDVFVFDTRLNKRTNVDKVMDFRTQDDSFYLENKIFTKLGSGTFSKPKKFKSDMFVEGKKAKDAEDRIVYDKKTGALYYDEDGTGAKAQVKIATITNKIKLTYHDFFVI